jgi:hypothetical protein
MISTHPLPANRVFVIAKDGQRVPWTPPEVPAKEPERPALAVVGYDARAAAIRAIVAELGVGAKPKAETSKAETPKAKTPKERSAHLRKAVVCLRPDGRKVRYPSAFEADKATGVSFRTIQYQCRNQSKSFGDYIFRYEGDAFPAVKSAGVASGAQSAFAPRHCTPVICRDLQGKDVRYGSVKAAAEATGVTIRAIQRMCAGGGKHPGKMSKYRFMYVSTHALE